MSEHLFYVEKLETAVRRRLNLRYAHRKRSVEVS